MISHIMVVLLSYTILGFTDLYKMRLNEVGYIYIHIYIKSVRCVSELMTRQCNIATLRLEFTSDISNIYVHF